MRGLLEFSRSRDFRFSYCQDENKVETEINIDQFEKLRLLLAHVNEMLLKELGFRSQLRKAIDFEAHYRLQAALIYRR